MHDAPACAIPGAHCPPVPGAPAPMRSCIQMHHPPPPAPPCFSLSCCRPSCNPPQPPSLQTAASPAHPGFHCCAAGAHCKHPQAVHRIVQARPLVRRRRGAVSTRRLRWRAVAAAGRRPECRDQRGAHLSDRCDHLSDLCDRCLFSGAFRAARTPTCPTPLGGGLPMHLYTVSVIRGDRWGRFA